MGGMCSVSPTQANPRANVLFDHIGQGVLGMAAELAAVAAVDGNQPRHLARPFK